MNYEIVELESFSGIQAKVYSIIPEGEVATLLNIFIEEHAADFRDEIKEILRRLKQIGHTTGARESFFKHEGDRTFVRKLMAYATCILKQLDDGELNWSNDGTELEGNFKNYNNE